MRLPSPRQLWGKTRESSSSLWAKICDLSDKHLNFFRIHMIFFCVTPCIVAGIFYGSNGTIYITYTDALFMCVSALTVTGLNSTPLADLTGWQQVIIFLLMTIGSTSSVSIVTILIRKHFFRKRFEHLVKTNMEARKMCADVEAKEMVEHPQRHLFDRMMHRGLNGGKTLKMKKKKRQKLNASMIRRTDEPGRPMHTRPETEQGPASETSEESGKKASPTDANGIEEKEKHEAGTVDEQPNDEHLPEVKHLTISDQQPPSRMRRLSEPGVHVEQHDRRFRKALTIDPAGHATGVPRTRTIEFAADHDNLRRRALSHQLSHQQSRPTHMRSPSDMRSPGAASDAQSFPRHSTMSGERPRQRSYKTKGYGGFPNPIEYGLRALGRRAEPVLNRVATVHRTQTMRAPTSGSLGVTRTGTIYSAYGNEAEGREVNYISFDAIVGRNSAFHKLTSAQEEELGGVEYRALDVLLYIVIFYYLGIQLISVAMIAPYLSRSQFGDIFVDNPDRNVPTVSSVSPTWFTFFNVWSAFSNNGMCLIDASLTVFQDTYFLLFVTIFNIFAGNTALPIFLRFFIWILSKIVPSQSKIRETLQFLLDHPRRCYIYLFPAYQTWFLLFVLIALNCTDWLAFLILDINNPILDQIPLGTRIVDGLQQAAAVRAAGFQVVNLQAVAPALQVLYVIMMYIAVYPIALSIRSTNVYESKSLGLYEEEDDEEEMDAHFEKVAQAGTYIAYHARKQLAFDIWWLVAALWVICIIERDAIADPSTDSWFNEFTVIFEIASAYGTVGLSLGRGDGSPTSLSGAFRNLAKIVMCAVMLRGRHRGLPNAIDRAVLLPSDMTNLKSETFSSNDVERMRMRARNRRASQRFGSMSENPEPPVNSDPADDADGWIDEPVSPGLSTIPASTEPSSTFSPTSTMAVSTFADSARRLLPEQTQFSEEPEECVPELHEKAREKTRVRGVFWGVGMMRANRKSKPPLPTPSLGNRLARLLFTFYLSTALCYTTWHFLLVPITGVVLHSSTVVDVVDEPALLSTEPIDIEAKIERALQIAEDKGEKLWGNTGKKKGSGAMRKAAALTAGQRNARSDNLFISHYDVSSSPGSQVLMSWHPANDARAHPSSKLAASLAQNAGIHRKASLMSEDLFLSKAFGETLQPSSVVPYYYKASNNITKEDITITTLITANRLRVLVNLAENYQGPVSVCLHVTDNAETKTELLESLHAIYTSNPSMMQWVDVHLVVDNFDRQFNMWRNVAKFFARTEYVMMLDVDFWICTDFRQRILSSPEIVSKLREGTAAFVVPAFEFNKQEDGMDVTKFPTEKTGLLSLVNSKKIDMFHKSWQPGHGATNYTRYYKTKPGEVYRVHSYTHSYEPYVVYKKEGTPYCDERFIGYGGNKAACLYELYLSGVSFFILPDDFLIHQSHPYAEKARKHERRYNRKLFTDFREELCFRYLSQFIESSQIDQARGKNLLIECKKIKGFTNAAAKLIAAGT